MSLDRTSQHPLHAQLYDDLRALIEGGDAAPGERLPTEAELAATYQVNRLTVRQAVAELARSGLVVVRQGRGTHVALRPQPIEVDITTDTWLVQHERATAAASAAGVAMEEQLLSVLALPALRGESAAHLGGPGPGVEVETLTLFDRVPAVRTRYWMRPEAGIEQVRSTLSSGVSIPVLSNLLGPMYYVWRAFDAMAATPRDAEVLQVAPGSPLLVRYGLNADAQKRPLVYLERNAPSGRMRILVRGRGPGD